VTLAEAYGRVLRETRKEKGYSQEKLAWEAGFARSAVSFLERGKRSPTLHTLYAFCKVLRVKPEDFITKVSKLKPKIELPE